jgi:L-ascorbate metabolism protein UlaG (beta-lactamase superfamily)
MIDSFLLLFFVTWAGILNSQPGLPSKDSLGTTAGKLNLEFLGHGSLMMEINSNVIYVDPCDTRKDYDKLPKADLILVTHEHQDHFDPKVIAVISRQNTLIISNPGVHKLMSTSSVLKNGESLSWKNIKIEAVPAYNTTAGRDKFHPRGRDNGYILTLGGKKIYIAGDTENIPELKDFGKVDVAVVPMNQPYTMTPEQVVKSVSILKPAILYPYHTTEADVLKLKELMKDNKSCELRIRVTD